MRLLSSPILLLLLAFMAVFGTANAQVSKKAKKLYPDYRSAYLNADSSQKNLDSAISWGLAILSYELDAKDKKIDTLFFGTMCFELGELLQKNYNYQLAVQYYLLAASSFEKIKRTGEAGKALGKYLFAFGVLKEIRNIKPEMGSNDSAIFSHGETDTFIWYTVMAPERKWNKNRDTIWVTINAGKAQSVLANSKLDVFTTFDTFASYSRKVKLVGTGFITEINDFSSTGFVALKDGFNDTVYDRDAWEVKIGANKKFIQSQFADLAVYNIVLYDYLQENCFLAGEGNLTINSPRFDNLLKKQMLKDLYDAAVYYMDIIPELFATTISGGRFKGMTYEECMKKSTMFDLEMFLDYVNSYPAKYLNREFKFAEVYLTWAMNEAPLGNSEYRVLDSIFSFNQQYLLQNAGAWYDYYLQIIKADSQLIAKTGREYQLDVNKKIEQYVKMQAFARKNNNSLMDSIFTINLVFENYSGQHYLRSLENANYIWPRLQGYDKRLISLYKGIIYSHQDKNEDALQFLDTALAIDSSYFYARGYKGWNLLKTGNVKQAFPHCLYAWKYDSTATWTNINLAHAYILKGNVKEANRLYRKSFDYMTVESDYLTGMEADFNYFINKGLNESQFLELKKVYNSEFNQNWRNLLVGDSLKQLALVYEDKAEFATADKLLDASIREYEKSVVKDGSRIRKSVRWRGYVNYKLKDYRKSLKYYLLSAEITVKYNLGDDNLASDYDDVSNIYDWLDDTLRQNEYRSRASAMEVMLREKREPKKLFVLSIGPESNGLNDSFAKSDAQEINTILTVGADLYFDKVLNYSFTGKDALVKNITNALDSAIYKLSENDVFIFYFSGYARNTYNEGIRLNDGYLSLRDLSGYLGQVPAGRQVHIADCNGLNWREWYQRGNFSLLTNEQRSLVFLGLKNSRIEDKDKRHSELTDALLKAYEITASDGSVSAAEWISKSVTDLMEREKLYAIEFQTFGHDFVLGKRKISLKSIDTFPPIIELFGATATRGENISLISSKGVSTGRITDDSRIVFAQANGISVMVASNGRFELPKELIGVKNVKIVAVDEHGNRAQREFVITQSENTSSSEGTRYAFLFASDDYVHWTDLANPIFDAKAIGNLLKNNYGYQVTIEENPSRRKITEKLDFIRRLKFKANDQLFVFFAGHGLYDSVWGGYYVCPESELSKNDKYMETYYPQQKIADLLDGTQCKNVFLVMDVCFGGKMFDKHDNNQIRRINDGNELSADEYIKRQLQIPCRQFLTSGGNNYVADGVPGSHSPFAARLIAALESGATNQEYITASEIMDYLRLMRTVGNDKKSLPRYGFFGGDKDGEYVLKVTQRIRNTAIIARWD